MEKFEKDKITWRRGTEEKKAARVAGRRLSDADHVLLGFELDEVKMVTVESRAELAELAETKESLEKT